MSTHRTYQISGDTSERIEQLRRHLREEKALLAQESLAPITPEPTALGGKIPSVEAVMIHTQQLPDNQRDLIRWLHAYAMVNDWSLKQTAAAIGKNWNTLYQVWRGTHAANKANFCLAIAGFKAGLKPATENNP